MSYEQEQKKLQAAWDAFMSDEDEDPFVSDGLSDAYYPSSTECSSEDEEEIDEVPIKNVTCLWHPYKNTITFVVVVVGLLGRRAFPRTGSEFSSGSARGLY